MSSLLSLFLSTVTTAEENSVTVDLSSSRPKRIVVTVYLSISDIKESALDFTCLVSHLDY